MKLKTTLYNIKKLNSLAFFFFKKKPPAKFNLFISNKSPKRIHGENPLRSGQGSGPFHPRKEKELSPSPAAGEGKARAASAAMATPAILRHLLRSSRSTLLSSRSFHSGSPSPLSPSSSHHYSPCCYLVFESWSLFFVCCVYEVLFIGFGCVLC